MYGCIKNSFAIFFILNFFSIKASNIFFTNSNYNFLMNFINLFCKNCSSNIYSDLSSGEREDTDKNMKKNKNTDCNLKKKICGLKKTGYKEDEIEYKEEENEYHYTHPHNSIIESRVKIKNNKKTNKKTHKKCENIKNIHKVYYSDYSNS